MDKFNLIQSTDRVARVIVSVGNILKVKGKFIILDMEPHVLVQWFPNVFVL